MIAENGTCLLLDFPKSFLDGGMILKLELLNDGPWVSKNMAHLSKLFHLDAVVLIPIITSTQIM